MAWYEGLAVALLIILGSGVVVSVIFLGMAWLDYSVLHNYLVIVEQDGRVLYEGRKACVSIRSGGDTTSITIRRGFLCVLPAKTYVGRGLTVRNG